jgi:hypothetical protein
MAIDVEIQDEQGLTIAQYNGPPLGNEFMKLAPPGSACFRFIDRWGDTTFNQQQIGVLRRELQDVAEGCTEPRSAELRALCSFLDGAVGVHQYVKFIGD